MESELHGRATAALFDICAAIHPRSIRSIRMRISIYNRPAHSSLLFSLTTSNLSLPSDTIEKTAKLGIDSMKLAS
jgi:hypothetical protein